MVAIFKIKHHILTTIITKNLFDIWLFFVQIRKDETVTEQGLTGCSIYNICNEYVEALGMKHWSPHDLRRTCASKLIDMGFALTSVRDYLGHSSISTTQLYDKSSSNRLNEIADKIKL